MDPVTGKWNWAKFKEYSDLMENEALKSEAESMHKHCHDGNFLEYFKLFYHNIISKVFFTF